MADLEPGPPDALARVLRHCLNEARGAAEESAGADGVESAVRTFLECWRTPVREHIEFVERCLSAAAAACEDGDPRRAQAEIESAQQIIALGLRDDLGLSTWDDD